MCAAKSLHIYFFHKKLCISLQFFNCWMLFQPWPVPMAVMKFKGIWSICLQNKTKGIWKRVKQPKPAAWASPFHTGNYAGWKVLPKTAKHLCQKSISLWILEACWTADTFPLLSCVLIQAGQNFCNYILTHIHTLHLKMKTKNAYWVQSQY